MAETMKNGARSVLSEAMEQSWKSPESPSRIGESMSISISSPKAPLRSLSYGNFKSIGAGSVAPTTKRATSVVEEMETKQRENMTRKLKGLQLSAGRTPQLRNKVEMPTIVDSRLAKTAALSRSTLRRDSVANYQAVTPAAAFSLKGGASPGTPSFSLKPPELFPLRASHSLTSLNRIYDGGLSVFASDDFDNYSIENGINENTTATSSVMMRPSLSSSVLDTALVRDIKPAEEKAVENAIGNIFRDSKAISLTGDVQPTTDKLRSKQDGFLTSGISSTTGPKLNLKTYPKPQIPSKPADLKTLTSKEEISKANNSSVGNAEESDSRAASYFPFTVASSTPRNSHQVISDFSHSGGSLGVTKDKSPTVNQLLEIQEKTSHLTKSYIKTADTHRRSPEDEDVDTRSVPRSPKPQLSFNGRSQVDVNRHDVVIPSTSDIEASDPTTRVSTRSSVVSGSRIGLLSNPIPCFINHQKMDSLLSDCNTVDSGIGRSEAAGSPGSLYQDSADELDNKGYGGWTASATDCFTDGRDAHHQQQQQKSKMQTKKEFVSTAEISLSPPVTETSKINSIEIKPTIQDTSVSTRQSYHQETPLPASLLRGTSQKPSDYIRETQRLSSVPLRSSQPSYSSSTTSNQPTSGFIALDSKVSVEAETSRPIRISGMKHPREEIVSVPNFDVQSNQRKFSENRKTPTSNFQTNFSEPSHTSGSRYTGSRESGVSEFKRRADDQPLRDLHENGTRYGDEPQRGRIKSTLFGDAEERKESRMDGVTQSYALIRNSQDKFIHDPQRTGTRTYVRETYEVRNDNNVFHEARRTGETRTDVRPTPEVKEYVARDPLLTERTHYRQTLANSAGFEPRRQSTGTKKEESITIREDDGMIEMEVQLIKGLTGLGFCIEGGIDSPIGDMPITVKRLFKGESAAKGKLQPGDVIVAINGKPMSNRSHYQAWNQLKSLPEGPINLAIRRRGPLPAATLV